MLRLEKAARNQDVALSIRARDPFLTHPLLLALGIAFALHLGAFVLFKIGTIKLHYSSEPSAVQVNADMLGISEIDAHVQASLDEPLPKKKYPFEPPGSNPSIPQIHYAIATYELPQSSLQDDLWLNILTDIEFIKSPKTFKIDSYGSLAALSMQLTEKPEFAQTVEPFRARFQVRVDPNGDIFWFQLQRFDGKPLSDTVLTNILKKLKFAKHKHYEGVTGEIELAFSSSSY